MCMPGFTGLSNCQSTLLLWIAAGGVVLSCQALSESWRKSSRGRTSYISAAPLGKLLEHTDGFPRKMCSNFHGDSCQTCPWITPPSNLSLLAPGGFKQGHYCIFELLGRISFHGKKILSAIKETWVSVTCYNASAPLGCEDTLMGDNKICADFTLRSVHTYRVASPGVLELSLRQLCVLRVLLCMWKQVKK